MSSTSTVISKYISNLEDATGSRVRTAPVCTEWFRILFSYTDMYFGVLQVKLKEYPVVRAAIILAQTKSTEEALINEVFSDGYGYCFR